jgi:cytochrome P450
MNFLQGFKTSVVGLISTLFLLATHPEHQERVREEIDLVFGDNRDGDVTLDEISRLEYLDRCVKEALRLFPPIAQMGRTVRKDIELGEELKLKYSFRQSVSNV